MSNLLAICCSSNHVLNTLRYLNDLNTKECTFIFTKPFTNSDIFKKILEKTFKVILIEEVISKRELEHYLRKFDTLLIFTIGCITSIKASNIFEGQILLGEDHLPLNLAPWGNVTILNLISGKVKSEINLGMMTDKNGQTHESSIIFGGLGLPNNLGETMLVGTVDAKAFYISIPQGKIIDEITLKRAGSVQPHLTQIDGCEAWVFIETGGRFSFYERQNNGYTIEAYKNSASCK